MKTSVKIISVATLASAAAMVALPDAQARQLPVGQEQCAGCHGCKGCHPCGGMKDESHKNAGKSEERGHSCAAKAGDHGRSDEAKGCHPCGGMEESCHPCAAEPE